MPKTILAHTKIVLIGSGNVATHLGRVFKKNGFNIIEVYSKSEVNAKQLASELNTNFTNKISKLTQDGTLYILCVKDDVIPELISSLSFSPKLLIHTSGCTSMNVLNNHAINHGVLYPLQTFSKLKEIDFTKVPLCIEGNSKNTEEYLTELAIILSPLVYKTSSEQRASLHLSAVFTCNFVNYMYSIGAKLLKDNLLSFEMLYPLIDETANKVANSANPFKLQTGPAIREDKKIIDQHLSMIEDDDLKSLYSTISKLIIKEKRTHEL